MQSLTGSCQSWDLWLCYLRSHSTDQAISVSLEGKCSSSLHSQRLFREHMFRFGDGITHFEQLQTLFLHLRAIHSCDGAYLQDVPLVLSSLQALCSWSFSHWMRWSFSALTPSHGQLTGIFSAVASLSSHSLLVAGAFVRQYDLWVCNHRLDYAK